MSVLAQAVRLVVDFALPPRCASCGTITDVPHSFCAACWTSIDWLGEGGCETCGFPLAGTDAGTCAACLAEPPLIERSRAAAVYDETSRILALRLKYSRKVALARTMARFMGQLIGDGDSPILIPVPLHRRRLWARGFNQAALIAGEISRQRGLEHDPFVLRRRKPTRPLKGLTPSQRRREVAGAFDVRDKRRLDGRRIVLVDDVLTTNSTARACAKVLLRAGAGRIELVCWARVIRPARLDG